MARERTASPNVAPSQGLPAPDAGKIEPHEVVPFTEGLLFTIRTFDRKELGGYYGIAVLNGGTI